MKTHFTLRLLIKNAVFLSLAILPIMFFGCSKSQRDLNRNMSKSKESKSTVFKDDVDFLKQYTKIISLQNSNGKAKIAVSPALQGRVMTSTSDGENGFSYGWINREAFLSGDTSKHFNVFGGEDRLWLGPEGGQYSIYFAEGKEFTLDNWYVPRLIDLEPFDVASVSSDEAVFTKEADLTNYSGTTFRIGIKRRVKVLEDREALDKLNVSSANGSSLVAYETINELKNLGNKEWKKETGLLSIWILGMFNPSDATTIVVPYQGPSKALREIVNDNYFGRIPDDRLKLVGKTVLFKADGKYRSKIGLSPENSPEWLGSYDAEQGVLTVVKYSKPKNTTDYVNSLWEIQDEPYKGDAVNAYNDGPPAPDAKPLGPFYELESSSPAAALQPDATLTHTHTTYHFKGTSEQLDPIILYLFGITSQNVANEF
jgi:hypothetical protein